MKDSQRNQRGCFPASRTGIGLVLMALVLLGTAIVSAQPATAPVPQSQTDNPPSTNRLLEPTARDKSIVINFARILEGRHFSQRRIDTTVSQQAFDLYIKAIDPMKLYFTAGDVQAFQAKYRDSFAILARKGDLSPAFTIYNVYLTRVDERCALAQQILDGPFDFTVDEEIVRDKDLLTFPKDDAEVADRWRKRVKFEILSLEADKRDEEKKEKNKEQDDTAQSNAEAAPNPWADETPVERLHRRYSSFQKRMRQTSNDDVLEIALTAIANVYDPHTSYLSPKSYENFNIQMSLNFEGIGATLGWEDGYTQVKEIVKGSPAQKQGELAVGDRIIGVGQGESGPIEDVVDMKLSDVVDKIRGKGGTVVRLQVIPGNRIIKIVRDRIDLDDSAAKGEIFQAGQRPDGTPYKIGVIDLPSFYLDTDALRRGETEAHGTVHDVQVILDQFVREKVDACVVDLRLNGGGILPEAISLTGLFVEGGTVVQVKPDPHRRGDKDSVIFHNDPDPGISWGGPLVVLTSRFSASASEIFAGAIKDYHRGLVVGDKTTHGKGSVQSVTPIADLLFGSMLEEAPNLGMIKVTVQGFWLPGGDTSQIRGIPSDVVIPSLTGHLEGIGESDLDNPLKLEKIQPAKYLPTFNYVTPEIVAALAKLSEDRTAKSPDFIKVEEKISLYDQYKSKKTTSLNREKYFAELEKLDSDKEEEEKIEKVIRNSSEITRDYYLDEVLNITSDYLNILASKNIVFEKEKSGSVLNFLGR